VVETTHHERSYHEFAVIFVEGWWSFWRMMMLRLSFELTTSMLSTSSSRRMSRGRLIFHGMEVMIKHKMRSSGNGW